MDRLTSMEVFVRVVEKGSFAAAAEASGLSTTMVANHVRALEQQLGAQLLERTTRRHHITEIGVAYLERCRDVLNSVQAADRVAEALRAEPQGTLRVTAPVTWGAHRLMPVVGAYMAKYPSVQVELSLNDRVVDLHEEGFDVAFRSGPLLDDALVARPLAPAHMFVVASPAYLQAHGVPEEPDDLAGHACLGFMAWGRHHHWRFTKGERRVEIPVQGPLVCNNGQALLSAALCGVGVVAQADVLLSPSIEAGLLVRLLPDWELPARHVHVVRRRETRPTAKLRTFVDFALQRLG
ncbi:LysR family transcriptional regulator [Dyella japonica]|uniref:LysR family transcriptional regulator n=1 Tax=Dyella japonica A8 TaxID=1217721 RepID=A0A075K5A5_9GAMM|nr:LysR family transcriptional regulator [Dyella japonica]AIF49290.1 LysR family transcriptional regulator [Dyella japonica A8]